MIMPLLSSRAGSNSVLFDFVEEGGPGDLQGGSSFYLVASGIYQGAENRRFFIIRDGLIQRNFSVVDAISEI